MTLQTVFYLSGALSDSCKAEQAILQEFLCHYVYLPCDGNQPTLPSREVCRLLRDEYCAFEWGQVSGDATYSYLLPDCESLPERSQEDNCSSSVAAATEGVVTTTEVAVTEGSGNLLEGSGDTSVCTANYSGSACTPYVNLCPSSNGAINSPSTDLEGQLQSLDLLYSIATDGECREQKDLVFGFLCRYSFHPCDDAGNVILPSRSTCLQIQEEICPGELQQLSVFSPALVPNCSLLPDEEIKPFCESPASNSVVDNSSSSTGAPLVLVCNEEEGFYLQNGTCQPRCSEWTTSDPVTSAVIDAIVLLSAIVGLIGGIAVIFFSILRHERMLTFPSVFIVYLTIDLIVLGVMVLVQYMDRPGLSCSADDNLAASLANPTTFCTLSGFIVFYTLAATSYWWFVHIASTFWKVMWPFHARKHHDKQKYIHFCLVVLGILLPFVPAVIALLVDGYSISKFPPILCIADNGAVAFYGLVLPICLTAGLGITFLIIILYTLQQKSGVFQHREYTGFLNLSAAEKKLLLIFFYYVILTTIDIILFSFSIANLEEIEDAITQNFLCEAVRTNITQECPKQYREIRISDSLYIVTYLLLGLFSTVNLLFAININEIKAKLKGCLRGRGDFRSRTGSTGVPTPDVPFSLQRANGLRTFSKALSTATLIRENGTMGEDGTYIPRVSSSSSPLPGFENSIFQVEAEAETPA